MKYLFFPGCKISAWLPEYGMATRAILDALSVELVDRELNCCGYPVRHRSFEASILSSARILSIAAKENLPVLTPCKCCFGNLRHARFWLRENRELRNRIRKWLALEGITLSTAPDVKHLLSVLKHDVGLDVIRSRITRPLQGLRVAVHYGCHALRPSNVVRFDDPLMPTIFEDLVSITGVRLVDWELRLDCCGAPLWGKNDTLSRKLTQRKKTDAINAGANILCTACTWCQHQFDIVSPETGPTRNDTLPAVMYPMLLGRAMGIQGDDSGMDPDFLP